MLKPWPIAVLALLSACSYKWSAEDVDGDGFTVEGGDCWDAEQGPTDDTPGDTIYPGASEVWYDGIDEDCAGDGDYDQDGDGVEVASATYDGEDCDDTDATVYPGAEDAWYDGVDSDCEDGGDPVGDYDQDGDGYDSAEYGGADCDDLDSAVNPDATETWYDGVDQNCDERNDYDQDGDGFINTEECDDEDPSRYPDDTIEEIWYNGTDENCDGNDGDQDGDGYVPDEYAEAHTDWAEFNAHLGTGDCWDDPDDLEGHVPVDGSTVEADQVYAGATETWYNGVDEDCSEGSDFDQDGDGYDSAFHADADGVFGDDCIDGAPEDDENPAGLSPAEVNPDAFDTWYDGTDQDCAGNDDYDQDSDGYQAEGYGEGSDDDCDDTLVEVNPDAPETCETDYDDDCDGESNDPNADECTDYYVDGDGDGEGGETTACLCEGEAPYLVTATGDCDDDDPDINTSATETVGDGVDGDCDGGETCYKDADKDTYRSDSTIASTDVDCSDAREALSTATEDCDDSDDDIHPGATEVTGDGVDEDCDGKETCYTNADGDAYRTSTTVTSSDEDCSDSGEALSSVTSGDCDDSSSSVYPGATETTGDGVDGDCDGAETCYTDADNDGYRKSSGTTASTDSDCSDSGEATSSDPNNDCKDTDATINPGATEIVGDGIDQTCDSKETCYVDGDGDDYRTDTTVTSSDADCVDSGEALSSVTDGDCDDGDDVTYPGATEVPEDGVINDCDATEAEALVDAGWTADYTMTSAYARRYGESASAAIGATLTFLSDADNDGDDELVLGGPSTAFTGSTSKGLVYVVNGTPSAGNAKLTSGNRKALFTGEANEDRLGSAVGNARDVDNDGQGDLLMGAPYNNSGSGLGDAGAAYLYLDSAITGNITVPTGGTEWTGAVGGDLLGAAAAGVGDLDDDGYGDFLLGATRADNGTTTNTGAVYLMEGPATTGGTVTSVAAATITGAAGSDLLGNALAWGGDVDGDGEDDMLLGASLARSPSASSDDNVGVGYLILGPTLSTASISSVADLILVGASTSDAAATSIAGAADVDGDGYDDLLVGAPGADTGATDGGAAYLIYGDASPSGSLTLSSADAIFTGVAASDAAGTSVAMADLTKDGMAELVIGAPSADPDAGTARGAAYLFFGGSFSGTASLSTANVIFGGESDGDALGTAVAAGGDVDEDGYGDLLLGAPTRDQAATDDGQNYYIPGTGY